MSKQVNDKVITEDLSFVGDHSYEGHDVFFEVNALIGEIGEFCNVIKKEKFYDIFPDYKNKVDQQVLNGRPSFREQEVDEAGDIFFYFIKVLNKRGISLEEVIATQVDKLEELSMRIGSHWKK